MAADVFISSAETSGDMHAGGLMRELLKQRPDLAVEAAGGQHLRDAGANVLFDTVTKATFGLAAFGRAGEVWAMLRQLKRRWRESGPPKLVICCDSWTLHKHVLKLAKRFGCRTMYYISPQAWASREGRTIQMARLIDRLACILPFEEQWLRDRGVNATFVGHPLFDHLPDPAVRESRDGLHVVVNFGSRLKTAQSHLPPLMGVLDRIRAELPDVRFSTPTVATTDAHVREAVGDRVAVELDGFDRVMATADFAVTVSGTATLHTAAHGVPMVVVYRASRFLWHALGRHIVKTRTYGLVNLLHPERRHVVPEFIPWFGDPAPVADAALSMLRDPAALAAKRAELAAVVDPLRHRGAGANAAAIAMELLND